MFTLKHLNFQERNCKDQRKLQMQTSCEWTFNLTSEVSLAILTTRLHWPNTNVKAKILFEHCTIQYQYHIKFPFNQLKPYNSLHPICYRFLPLSWCQPMWTPHYWHQFRRQCKKHIGFGSCCHQQAKIRHPLSSWISFIIVKRSRLWPPW